MPTLRLKFAIDLRNDPLDTFHHGPWFHRWLPDGEKDALALVEGAPNVDLKVWFERRGVVQDNFIKYDVKRREVDPSVMARQGRLDAGPLFGALHVRDVTEAQLAAVRSGKQDDPDYMALGKRLLKDVIVPPVSRFLSAIRINCGQYWVAELPAWDAREYSLGGYCHKIHLEWSDDDGTTWAEFLPDKPIGYLNSVIVMGDPEGMYPR